MDRLSDTTRSRRRQACISVRIAPALVLMLPVLVALFIPAAVSLADPRAAVPGGNPGGLDGIPVCHGFGCRYKDVVSISAHEWNEIKAFFQPPASSPEEERQQIRKAAGWFEVIMGHHTPINLDQPKDNFPGRFKSAAEQRTGTGGDAGKIGQLDCVDDSLNMTTYLTLMDKAGLFKFHKAVERAYRRSAVDQHFAGQIEEIGTGKRWVVDSWFYGYGSLPVVEAAKEWSDVPFLFGTSW